MCIFYGSQSGIAPVNMCNRFAEEELKMAEPPELFRKQLCKMFIMCGPA